MSEREAVVTSDKQNGGKFSEEMKVSRINEGKPNMCIL